MLIPIMTLLTYAVIFLNIPIFRDIIVFIYLSFIPGFALLKLLKLKETSFLDTILFSAGLSIAFLMFMGWLVNELYVILGLSQPLSTIPLTIAISAATLIIFFIEYRRDLSETSKLSINLGVEPKNVFPLSIILVLLPILSALGVLYLNVSFILLSCSIIAILCVMSIGSKRLVPENLFPFLIFSISISLMCLVILTSKYIVGWDANLEYYVFRLTQINGHWGFLNANINPLIALNFNSMLSITLLPAIYSAMMNANGEIVFKILYPFIFSLIPLALYRIFEKQFGKLIGLLSTLFFIFTSSAFYGLEPLSLDRQIVGEFFLLLSVFLLVDRTIPMTKRRLLLVAFGVALAVSHYSLAFLYLSFVVLVFIVSKIKPKIDRTINFMTIVLLLLFVLTFSFYAFYSNSVLPTLANAIKAVVYGLSTGNTHVGAGTATNLYSVPQVFTAATWINLAMLIIPNLLLIIGILVIILKPKGTGISDQFRIMSIAAAIVLAASTIVPSFATSFNFSRFYAITILFLSPCFVFGGQTLLVTIRKTWTKIKRSLKRQIDSKSKNMNIAFLLIAIILGGYFLSQLGFVNRVTGDKIKSYYIDFDRIQASDEAQVKVIFLVGAYIPEQDVSSAVWLLNHKVATAKVYADGASESHALISYGLIPDKLILPLTNATTPEQFTLIYLSSLNVVYGVITTSSESSSTFGAFNTSEISPLLNNSNLIYSNGASEIWSFSG
jgi:uncharacterized membrane protein